MQIIYSFFYSAKKKKKKIDQSVMEPYWDLAKRKKNIEIVHVFWLDHLLKFNLDLGLKYLWEKKKLGNSER